MKGKVSWLREQFGLTRRAKVLLFVLSVCLVIVALPALAGLIPWRLVSETPPVSLGNGATYVSKRVKGPVETEIHLVFFDTKQCDVRVVEQPTRKDAVTLEQIAITTKAMAVCNAGYFHVPNFLPSGLQIVKGERQGKLVEQSLWGCFLVRSGVAELVPVEQFKDDDTVTDLVQCSPMYVMDGRALQLGAGGPRNTRTFALTDQAGHWAIGTCKNIALQEMADLLVTPGIIREFAVKRAMNLDGGPSTGLWCKAASGSAHYEKESWRVKNALVITPRNKPAE